MLLVTTHDDDAPRELTLVEMGGPDRGVDDGTHVDGGELVDVDRRAREVLATFADGRQQVRNQVPSAVHDGADTFDLALPVDDGARTGTSWSTGWGPRGRSRGR